MCRRRLSRSFPYQNVSRETFCTIPSLDKDTHAFSSDATFASVVLTLTGSPPRCGASSSPHKVLRPCVGPTCKSTLTASSNLEIRKYSCGSLPCHHLISPRRKVLRRFCSAEMPPEEVRSGRQAGACQRDAQCQAAFMSAKTVCALVKQRYKKKSPRKGAERLNHFQVKGFFFISAAVRG